MTRTSDSSIERLSAIMKKFFDRLSIEKQDDRTECPLSIYS